jgi:cytochrome c6
MNATRPERVHFAALALLAGTILWQARDAQAADMANGARIYQTHCIACHGIGGRPMIPNAPAFFKGERLTQPDFMLTNTIKSGKNQMPAFLGILKENDIRDVLTYIRTLPGGR